MTKLMTDAGYVFAEGENIDKILEELISTHKVLYKYLT